MDQTFYDLKRLFRRELDEVIKHKTTAVMGGSCADYIMYKAEVGKVFAYEDAYQIFTQVLAELVKGEEDDEQGDAN